MQQRVDGVDFCPEFNASALAGACGYVDSFAVSNSGAVVLSCVACAGWGVIFAYSEGLRMVAWVDDHSHEAIVVGSV